MIECRDPASLTKPDEKYLVVATHSGRFHADDVVCVSLVSLFSSKPIILVRTRDEEIFSKCHMILDVGRKDFYGQHQLRLDHHQSMEDYIINGQAQQGIYDKLYYKNGLKKATCGKLADWMFLGISDSFLDFLRSKVLYSLEARDNGITITHKISKDINNNIYPLGFIPAMNPSTRECKEYGETIASRACFIKAEEITKQILSRLIEEYENKLEEDKIVNDMLDVMNSSKQLYLINDKTPILDLDTITFNWNKTKSNKIGIRSVMQRSIGEDNLWVVKPIPKKDGGYYKNIPGNWKGKDKEQLKYITPYSSIEIISGSRVIFSDKEEAIKFTKYLAEK